MEKKFLIFTTKNGIIYLIIVSLLMSLNKLDAKQQDDQGTSRQSRIIKNIFTKFIKPKKPSTNCYNGLHKLESEIKKSEEKLFLVVNLIRQLVETTTKIVLRSNDHQCDYSNNSTITFDSDNTVDNSNTNHFTDKDIYNFNSPKDDDHDWEHHHPKPWPTTSTKPSTTPTTPSTTPTTPSTTPTTPSTTPTTPSTTPTTPSTTTVKYDQPKCFDVGLIILDWTLDEFYTIKTTFPQNTPKCCAKFCLLLSYSYSAVNDGGDCYCSNRALNPNDETDPRNCNVKCPGDPSVFCGGKEMKYITYQPTNAFTIEQAIAKLPSGVCRKVFLRFNEAQFGIKELFTDNSPEKCKMYCTLMGYRWACAHRGSICGCDEARPEILQTNQAFCDFRCPGDRNLFCGSSSDSASCFPTGIN